MTQPFEVFVDIEKAIYSAFLYSWANVKINDCRFHLYKNLFKKIQSLCLVVDYNNINSEAGKWPKYMFGLTYLNPEEVED